MLAAPYVGHTPPFLTSQFRAQHFYSPSTPQYALSHTHRVTGHWSTLTGGGVTGRQIGGGHMRAFLCTHDSSGKIEVLGAHFNIWK